MSKKILLFFLVIFYCLNVSYAQETNKYWVYVDEPILSSLGINKLSTPALSQRSLDRRLRQNIPLRSFDYSMPNSLADMVESTGANVRFFSRWLRAFSVEASEFQYHQLSMKKWIKEIVPVRRMVRRKLQEEGVTYGFSYGQSLDQTTQINLSPVHDLGYAGQGILIGLMDGGFSGVESHSVFQGAWNQGRIVLTKDFVDGDTNVFHVGSHGMSVLSTICADINGTFVGTAPEASFALFRTENELSETIAEEDNWVWASEWADSIGVDITNTSLGYTTFDNGIGDHTYSDLDGRTSVISIAANISARVGIIVVAAAGNEGASSWKYISCPADADSILSVGAVDSQGIRSAFSSQGPTSDGRIKPDLMARGSGATVMTSNGTIGTSSGTSFASPIICGATASLLQLAKSVSLNYDIQVLMNMIRNSSSNAFNPDSLYGYGIPNYGSLITTIGINEDNIQDPFSLTYSENGWLVSWTRSMNIQKIEILDYSGRILFENKYHSEGQGFTVPKYPFGTIIKISTESEQFLKIPPFGF